MIDHAEELVTSRQEYLECYVIIDPKVMDVLEETLGIVLPSLSRITYDEDRRLQVISSRSYVLS